MGIGTDLFLELDDSFIGVLSGQNAALYVDVLDALERASATAGDDGGLVKSQAAEVASRVIGPAEMIGDSEAVARANLFINRLVTAGWLEEPRRADFKRRVYVRAEAVFMLEAFRRVACDADLFINKLHLVCAMISNPETFTLYPWNDVESCVTNAQLGIQELRMVGRSVERMIRKQTRAESLADNLRITYHHFAERIAQRCYSELVRLRIPIRLVEASERLDKLMADEAAIEKMQIELVRRNREIDPASTRTEALNAIGKLRQLLLQVTPLAEIIDRRASEFAQRSLSRLRYLQEVGSRRREQIKSLFLEIDTRFAGKRLGDLDISLPFPLIAAVALTSGADSLAVPRTRAVSGMISPVADEPTSEDKKREASEVFQRMHLSLTPQRANRFISTLRMGKKRKIASCDIPVASRDDLESMLALLINGGTADANYTVQIDRVAKDADVSETDVKAGWRVDQFHVESRR